MFYSEPSRGCQSRMGKDGLANDPSDLVESFADFSLGSPRHNYGALTQEGRTGVDLVGGSFRADYRLTGNVLDTGADRRVETATHKQTGRTVVVKSFNLRNQTRREYKDLWAEIETQSAIDHPNVARLQAVYSNGKNLRLVMEHLEGGDIFDHLVSRGSFTESETAMVIKQLLEAVEHLHSHGVTHRDIKLENMVYESKSREKVKLIDFGYSTFWQDGERPMHRFCGTKTYLAPEVSKGAYTNKVDLWCVGVSAHAMLTGNSIGWSHAGAPMLADEFRGCSPACQDFVSKLLRTDPSRRMSASEALRHPWLQAPGRQQSASESPPAPSQKPRWRRRISALWTALRRARTARSFATVVPETQVVPSHG